MFDGVVSTRPLHRTKSHKLCCEASQRPTKALLVRLAGFRHVRCSYLVVTLMWIDMYWHCEGVHPVLWVCVCLCVFVCVCVCVCPEDQSTDE